ncbi:MAG: hypothetical protein GY929_09440 [Actinomycetia bacterium]|nr:hypothetical protein [Actinomycetes bacterium]
MASRLRDTARLLRSTLTAEQQKTALRLGWLSIVVLVGVTATGAWQLFAHEPDPGWFDYAVDSNFQPGPRPLTEVRTGVAAIHRFFGGAGVVLAGFGGGWFAYRVVHRVARLAVVIFVVGVISMVTGAWLRFRVVKLSGESVEDAGRGYFQLFLNDVDFVITDTRNFEAMGIRLLTVAHVISVPILLVAAWFAITRAGRLEEFSSSQPRKPELGPRQEW